MLGDIPVEIPTRADLEDDEHIEDAEAGRYHREEVTGHDRVRMIPHKRRPALGSPSTVPRTQTPDVPTHRARRHGQSQFEEEFVRDPFFTPGRVRLGHAHDESLQLPRNGRSSWSRPPPPEEPPALTMPPDERVWLDHREERASPAGVRAGQEPLASPDPAVSV